MKSSYLTLMLVTDPEMTAERGLIWTVLKAIAGGVTSVQLRDKNSSDAVLIEQARSLRKHLAPLDIPLIVNDRPEVAKAAEADGLHIGQDDGNPGKAREIIGRGTILGLSVTKASEIDTVDPTIVDYVGLGPVFSTATKADAAPALAISETADIGARLPVPWIGIGGIGAGNASEIRRIGAAGVACVSSICAAADPRSAAAKIRQAMEREQV